MNRKIGGWLLLAGSVLGLILLSGIFWPAKTVSELSISDEEWAQICSTRVQTDAALLQDLRFNGYSLLLDQKHDCFYYSLIEDDPQAMDPQVRSDRNVQVAFCGGAITEESVAAAQTLQMLAYDDQQYRIYTLACTTLPLLSIQHGEVDADIDAEQWTGDPMQFYLFDNRAQATQRVISTFGVAHVRGNTSRYFPKKGYRLTLLEESLGNNVREYAVSLLGMRQDGDWLLYAGYNDFEKVRNVFSSNLWMAICAQNNRFGLTNGMEYRYVELFLDGEYWGLYALGYPVDAKQLKLETDLAGNYTEYVFKPMWWSNANLASYELSTPTAHERDAWDTLEKYYDVLCGSMDTEQIYGLADMDNAIDIYLFYNLIQACDSVYGPHSNAGSPENIFNTFICFKGQGEDRTVLYTPWDMDYSWSGNVQDSSLLYSITIDENYIMGLNPVNRLHEMGDSPIHDLVKLRFRVLRRESWSDDNVTQMLDELEKDIFDSGAFLRDRDRWPEGNYVDPALKLSKFKEYVTSRLGYLDWYYNDLWP